MDNKTTYERITEARQVLDLPEEATMSQIRKKHRRLIQKWHPDHNPDCREACERQTKRINAAYRVIMNYVAQYRYSFSKKEVEKYETVSEWWLKRFGQDPLWSGGDNNM